MIAEERALPPLTRVLGGLRDQLCQLAQALDAEHAAVRDFDVDALQRAVATKSAALSDLLELDRARRDHLQHAGLGDTASDMRALTEDEPALAALWLEIEALTREARRAMETNAIVLHAHHRLATDSLRALYGDRGEPALYQGHAELRARAPTRSLGRV